MRGLYVRGRRPPRCSGARGRRQLRPPDRPPAAGHTGFSPGGRRRTAGRTQQTDACSRTRSGEARLGSSSGRARLEKCPAESSPYARLISSCCARSGASSSRSGPRNSPGLKSQKPPELSRDRKEGEGEYKESGVPKNSRRPGFPGAPSRTLYLGGSVATSNSARVTGTQNKMVPHAAWPCAIFFLACVRRAFEAQLDVATDPPR